MSASRLKIPESYRDLARIARRLGWVITRHGSGHLRWTPPQGGSITTPSTPGDGRGIRNSRAALRRAGLRTEEL